MLYHGPVRVPEDAREGKAKLEVRLTSKAGFSSIPTLIDVQLVQQ